MNSTTFCPDRMKVIKTRINDSIDTSVLGLPGAGISTFLMQVCQQSFGRTVFLDAHNLPKPNTTELCKLLLQTLGGSPKHKTLEELVGTIIERLQELTIQHNRVVICIGGFDQLQPNFNHELFHTLKTFKGVNPQRIVFLLGICRRMETLVNDRMIDIDHKLLSSVYYLKPYSRQDLLFLLSAYGSAADLGNPNLDLFIELSGGNFQFLRLLLNNERQNAPAEDPFIRLAFRNMYQTLSTKQKHVLKQITQGKNSSQPDDYLLNVGLVRKTQGQYELFSPLFTTCLQAYTKPRLPAKEQKLFRLLKKNCGYVVSKQEIYDVLWPDGNGSEWALNALVYRLRKHPAFMAQNYSIGNAKKIGYILTKND